MQGLVAQINAQFTNTILAPVILLDGGWGVGKTHFVTEEYIKETDRDCILISLMGITTLQHFHEKLLSQYLLKNNSKQADNASSVLSGVTNTLAKVTGLAPLVESISGIAKHTLLNQISNITLIIDDLERVSDSNLRAQILGEVYDMCNSNRDRNIQSLVIMNHSMSQLDHSLIEKIFCWHFKYELSMSKAFRIGFASLNNKTIIESYLTSCLKEIDTFNLRVLMRLSESMNQVSSLLESIGEDKVDIQNSKEHLFKRMIHLSYFYYNLGHSVDTILTNLNETLLSDSVDVRDKLYTSQRYKKESRAFIEFTIGCLSRELKEEDLQNLSPARDELFEFINARTLSKYSDEIITNNINKLLNYVLDERSPSLSKWYSAVNFLAYLGDIGVSDNVRLVDLVTNAQALVDKLRPVKELHYSTFIYDKGLNTNIYDLEKLIEKNSKETELSNLQDDIRTKQWTCIDRKVYDFVTNNHCPFTITAAEWLTSIKRWENSDIELFWSFCMELNNQDGLSYFIDKNTLKTLVESIMKNHADLNYGLRKGLLNRLGKQFEGILNESIH